MIKQVLDGNLDGNQYEDMLREMFGIHAYIGFTMDKVVQNIVRQLQHIVSDDCYQTTELFIEESKSTDGVSTGGPVATQHLRATQEINYQKKAEQLLTDENCFKLMIYKQEGKITVELLDTESTESDDGAEYGPWSGYVERYARNEDTISDDLREILSRKPVFLPRNIPTWRLRGDRNQDDIIEETKERTNKVTTRNTNTSENKEKSEKPSSPGSDSENKLEVSDNTQCKFNVNNYKMVFVVDSEHYMYRRNSIKKARLVSSL